MGGLFSFVVSDKPQINAAQAIMRNDDMAGKDLAYFEEHPDEIPDDEETLNRIYDGETIEGETGETKPVEDKPVENEDAAADAPDDEKVLLAKDGKNHIPYSVLESARSELAEAQRIAKEADEREKATRAEIEALKASAENTGADEQEQTALDELEEDYGDTPIAKAAKEQAARTETLEERLDRLESEKQEALQEKELADARAYETEVNAAIDRNPTLKEWRQNEERWDDVQAMNAMLMQKEEWQSRSLDEISTEIVRRLGGLVHSIPGTVDASTTPTPKSLSDLPAGEAPAQTVAEEVARLSDSEFRLKYDNCKTDDERDALLSAAGM